ncbi:MAG: hypothetical protein Q9218_005358 [Villophora microphyllina]
MSWPTIHERRRHPKFCSVGTPDLSSAPMPRLPHTSLFSVHFEPKAYYHSALMIAIVSDPTHVLRNQILSRMQSRPKQGLWMCVSANGFPAKATVRRWAKRRVKVALKEELKLRGFGADGISLAGKHREVKGTMNVYVKKETLTAGWSTVRAEVGRLAQGKIHRALGDVLSNTTVNNPIGTLGSTPLGNRWLVPKANAWAARQDSSVKRARRGV